MTIDATQTRNAQRRSLSGEEGIAIGPILFVVAILGVLVSALVAGSGGFGTSTATEGNKIVASTVLQQGSNLKSALDRILATGETLSTVIVSTNLAGGDSATNARSIYAPTGGGLTLQTPPAAATPVNNTTWRFVALANIEGIGTAGANDYAAVLPIRSQAICLSINELIFGASSVPATLATIPVFGTNPSVSTDTATAGENVALGLPTAANSLTTVGVLPAGSVLSRTNACIQTTNGGWWYYTLLNAG